MAGVQSLITLHPPVRLMTHSRWRHCALLIRTANRVEKGQRAGNPLFGYAHHVWDTLDSSKRRIEYAGTEDRKNLSAITCAQDFAGPAKAVANHITHKPGKRRPY